MESLVERRRRFDGEPATVPAGLLRMRFKSFFLASLLGTASWTAILAGAGYKLQNDVTEVERMVGPISNAVLVVLAVGYVWRLWTHRHQKHSED